MRSIYSLVIVLLIANILTALKQTKNNLKPRNNTNNVTNDSASNKTVNTTKSNNTDTDEESDNKKTKISTVNYQVNAYRFVDLNGISFDLHGLSDSESDYTFNNGKDFFYLNIGDFGKTKCNKDNTYLTYFNRSEPNSTDCNLLSGSNNAQVPQWRITSKYYNNFLAENNTNNTNNISDSYAVIEITLPKGDRCDVLNKTKNSPVFYQTIFEITCDPNIAKLAIDNPREIKRTNCINIVKMRSKQACPDYTTYSFSNSLRNNSVLFAIVLLIGGIYFTYFSYKYEYHTRFFTGVMTTLFICLYILANHLQFQVTGPIFWGMVLGSLGLGIIIGLLMVQSSHVPAACLGLILGFVFSEIFYQSFVSVLKVAAEAVYWTVLALSCIFMLYMSCKKKKFVFIISAAFLGSYAIIRAIGTAYDNYPHEQHLFKLIDMGEWAQVASMIDYKFYLYNALAFIIGISGIFWQFKRYFKDIREDDYYKHDD